MNTDCFNDKTSLWTNLYRYIKTINKGIIIVFKESLLKYSGLLYLLKVEREQINVFSDIWTFKDHDDRNHLIKGVFE